ncbi:MAG: KAP family NTPase [Muribaculaceae bacterium]|nr:KAP family NTPase [Muribaculaceae bacterium]
MKQLKKTSLSDIPFYDDINDFGTERYVNGLIKFIENSSTPITIALQGEWGSGKTSLMTRLRRALCIGPNAPFIGIEINTWEHSMMTTPEVTVYKIMSQLVKDLTGSNADAKKKVSGLLRGLYRGGREALKMIPGVNVAMEMANVPAELPFGNEDGEQVSLSYLKEELEKSVSQLVNEGNKRGVIIFVDDLDRLNPPVAVEILELLKNVFTLDHCIFVLAIDYEVVVKGLEPKFGKLNDNNEREFRSFFDKIIQVPFSLPVSSYRPMDFVLKALVGIGYIKDIDSSDPNVRTRFAAVVEASVGKNPRSIKRLINTLSLLDCIAQCGTSSQKEEIPTMEEKLLNFIVVALQICYPKIYRMLVDNHAFTSWDREFANKEGITLPLEKKESEELEWDDILEAACLPDKYLSRHFPDIMTLFTMMREILERVTDSDSATLELQLQKILDKSSVTGINTSLKSEEFNRRDFMGKLHNNVVERLKHLRPDILSDDSKNYKLKKNTGNGGIYIYIDKNTKLDIVFSSSLNDKNEISLRIWTHFHLLRPQNMIGMEYDDLMKDNRLFEAISAVDNELMPLLKSAWFFKGTQYEGQKSYFTSFGEELRYIHSQGRMSGEICNNPEYWIELKKPSHFEEPKIVDAIAKVIIANYDFRKKLKDFK